MRDNIELQIDNRRVENFLAYTLEADIYTADDAFSLDVANPEIEIAEGGRCRLRVNNTPELTGIIDRVSEGFSKRGEQLRVEGRDLCGLLVDSYCEEFIDVQGMTVKALAERLIKNVPYIQRSDIIYQQDIKGNLKRKKSSSSGGLAGLDTDQNFSKIEPGQTVFEVLKTYAGSRGLMFYAMPDGTFVFGKPKDGGVPQYTFIRRKSDPRENNVLEGTLDKNISRRYSKVTIVGQQQGTDSTGAGDISTIYSATDPAFPFYKPYVAVDNNDAKSPKLRAQMMLEKQKYQGFQISYRVRGHSQNGKNYAINEMCHVIDEKWKLDGDYLIYGRTFEMSKQWAFTTLKIGLPGAIL
jgi:prophage tail gpP-like protein